MILRTDSNWSGPVTDADGNTVQYHYSPLGVSTKFVNGVRQSNINPPNEYPHGRVRCVYDETQVGPAKHNLVYVNSDGTARQADGNWKGPDINWDTEERYEHEPISRT